MSSNIAKNWAVAATAIALVLLGVVIGQRTGRDVDSAQDILTTPATGQVAENAGHPAPGASAPTSTDAESDNQPAPYVIPDAFVSLPSEWRTAYDEGDYHGYAILFDPPRREVIIEKCFHPGHFSQETGQPVPEGWEFCDNVLWGQLVSLDEHTAHVQARNGTQLDLTLSLDNEDGQSHLALSFPGHSMDLIPGSKNDLFQAMDKSPEMTEQRRQAFEFGVKAEEQLRRQLQSKTSDTGTEKDQG